MMVLGIAQELACEVLPYTVAGHAADARAPRRPASCSRPPSRGRTSPTTVRRSATGRASPARSPTAAPARCPAHGPTSANRRRWSRSRQTMNAQRCWFFELLARRPARRMCSRWSSSSGRSAKRRTTRRDDTASQTRTRAPRDSPAGPARRPQRAVSASTRLVGARQRDLDECPEAARHGVDRR